MSIQPEIRAAAVVYRIGEHDRRALADFARELAANGCRLGGMVQQSIFDDQGRRTRIDSVDLATGVQRTANVVREPVALAMAPDGRAQIGLMCTSLTMS